MYEDSVKQESEISRQMDEQRKLCSELAEISKVMESRLNPVLRGETEKDVPSQIRQSPSVPLAVSIDSNNMEISRVIKQMSGILSRLGL